MTTPNKRMLKARAKVSATLSTPGKQLECIASIVEEMVASATQQIHRTVIASEQQRNQVYLQTLSALKNVYVDVVDESEHG
jgi:hypothetical protein